MRKIINIDDLCLALDNPRLTDSQNEDEEIEKLVSEQKQKLVILAEDIIDHGLNPLDTIAVYPSEKNKGKYVVAEGNRRIAVIKILNNPDLIIAYNQAIYNKFTQLKLKYDSIHEIDTWIFGNSADPELLHWIEIKHLGEQKGKGVSSWDAIQKERFDQKIRGESRLLDFWADLEKYNILDYDQIMSITKTNWERILRDTGISFLGIYKIGSSLKIPMDNLTNFIEKIRCVQKKLANQTVGIVYDQEKIEAFFDDVSKELYGKPVDKKKQLIFEDIFTIDTNVHTDAKYDTTDGISKAEVVMPEEAPILPIDLLPVTQSPDTKNTPKDPFNGCRTTIPYGYAIRSSNTRINRIIQELKTLIVDVYPNSCGVLLRLLFELSAKHYIESISLTDKTEDDFQKVISFASNELRGKGLINNNEHSALTKDIDTLRLLFNGYVHNTDSYPSSEAIKSIFKAHKKFLSECLK